MPAEATAEHTCDPDSDPAFERTGAPERNPAETSGISGDAGDVDKSEMPPAIASFLESQRPGTPCLVMDLGIVEDRYRTLASLLPSSMMYYALKANAEPEVVALLAELGSSFDVASPAEIELCLKVGVTPDRISYGNTMKKEADIARAYERGVRLFAFDSTGELEKLARAAPGASVFCRLLTSGAGADWPLNRKFGCDPAMAVELLTEAHSLGLDPVGTAFHVGSQQRDPSQWDVALADAAAVHDAMRRLDHPLKMVNLGGGFPADYLGERPPIEAFGRAISEGVERHFGDDPPETIIEPGRYVVADAGVLHTEVVLVSRKSARDDHRWVYLDTGVFGGLAETLDEAIKYPIVTSHGERPAGVEPLGDGPLDDGPLGDGPLDDGPLDDGPADADAGLTGPVILAGPTCDSIDVMYETFRYGLPLDLEPGDHISFLSAGAYTKAYCTDGFNGFFPMPAYCLPSNGARTRKEENCHSSPGSGGAMP